MKMFKKLMAVALVAVMALCVFTACGADTDDMKDAIKDKTSLTFNSSLRNNSEYKTVKKILDDLDAGDKVTSKLTNAITAANAALGDDTVILIADNDDKDGLAKDIKNQITALQEKNGKTYKTFACDAKKSHNDEHNAVIVIISTAEKTN